MLIDLVDLKQYPDFQATVGHHTIFLFSYSAVSLFCNSQTHIFCGLTIMEFGYNSVIRMVIILYIQD